MARTALVICPRIPFPPRGGAAKRTLRLLEAMAAAGAVPHLVTTDGTGDADALRARGWRVDVLEEPPPGALARVVQHARRLPSPYLRSVETHLRSADRPAFVQAEHTLSAYYVAEHPAPRWVLSTHNVDSALLHDIAASLPRGPARARGLVRAAATKRVERTAAPRADAVLCVSDADAAYYARLGAKPVLVPNGVDDDLLDAPAGPPEADRVLFFGQLDYLPNAVGLRRFLADGWPRLLASRPGARLRVVGPGAAERLEHAPNVELAGFVDDIGAELAAAAVVVVPLWQGGGTRLKVLEALARSRPVVSTPLGATGIGFRDGEHGLLAADPAGLADAAFAVLGDPALAARLGAGGHGLAERFRWSAVTEPARALYADWVSSPPA
ncbi:MAG TPA: glycosyltransferase [Solirubrobacter sp.]|nr:glycosyltransferase [Solirubrobacter sp.]